MPRPGPARTPRRADPRGGRRRGGRRRVRAVYPVLRALEEAGRIRRGYFVDGLGAAQFALAGAVDRLRAVRDRPSPAGDRRVVHLLAAADPANPYGAALPWPRRDETDRRPFQRAAGAYVVLVDGVAALYLDRGGSSLQTLPAAEDPAALRPRCGAGGARGGRPDARARHRQGGRRAGRGLPVPRCAPGCRVRARLPRLRVARGAVVAEPCLGPRADSPEKSCTRSRQIGFLTRQRGLLARVWVDRDAIAARNRAQSPHWRAARLRHVEISG